MDPRPLLDSGAAESERAAGTEELRSIREKLTEQAHSRTLRINQVTATGGRGAHQQLTRAQRHARRCAQVAIPVLSPQARISGGAPVTSHHGGMAPSHPSLRAAPAHALPRRRRYPWPEPSAHLICSALLPINARDRVALPLNGLGRCSRCVFSASALLPSPFQLPR